MLAGCLVTGLTSGCVSDLSEKLADLGGAADGGADSAVRPTPTTTPDVPDADVPTSPTTPAPTIPDEAGTGSGPTLVDSEPASGAVDVNTNTDLTLVFDRGLVAGDGSISLHESINDAEVERVPVRDERVTIDENQLSVDWLGVLSPSTGYYVLVEADAVRDDHGTPFAGITDTSALSFSTRTPPRLTLVETVPENQAINVPRTRSLRFTFNQDVLPGAAGDITIVEAETGVAFEVISAADEARAQFEGDRLTVDPQAIFGYQTKYYVTIDPGAVVSEQGAAFPGVVDDSVLSFTTAQPPPLALAATSPADDAVGVDPTTSLVLAFDEPVFAQSGEIRIYRAGESQPVESAAIGDDNVAVAGFTVTVDLTLTLEAGQEYVVRVDPGIVRNELGSSFVGITNDSAFTFTTAEEALTELTLDATTPTAGATSVPVSTQLLLYFSEDVVPGPGLLTVFHAGTDAVVETVEVSDSQQLLVDGDEVTVYLDAPLEGSTEYYVTLSAGAFVSHSGASFGGIGVDAWSFTTETVFGLSATSPSDNAVGVNPATNLTLTFTEDVTLGDGQIEVRGRGDDALVEAIAVSDPRVSVAGATVSVDLDNILASQTEYYVTVEADAVVAAGGDTWSGVQGSTAWNFTTEAVDFPAGTGSGLVLWLDASYAASVKLDDGVRLWADRSGRFNNVTQASGSAKPQLVPDAINERAALRFDGDDRLQAATGLALSAFDGLVIWQSEHAIGSSRKTSLLSNDRNTELNHSHPFSAGRNATASCVGNACDEDEGWFTARFTPTPSPDQPQLWNWSFDPVTTSLFARSGGSAPVVESGPTNTPVAPATPLLIGDCTLDDCGFEGDIAEVVLYSRLLTPPERKLAATYLREKWGIAAPSCDTDEHLGPNGSCYYLSANNASWSGARSACRDRGAGWDLATIRSPEDHTFAASLLTSETAIGGSDSSVEGTWRWVNDTLQFYDGIAGAVSNGAYVAWASDAPGQSSSNNCLRYVESASGGWSWSDYDCSTTSAYLCEGPGN